MMMKISTNLPDEIKNFHYAKNHHYIELEDYDGNRHKVLAKGLIKGECKECKYEFYSETNHGDIRCPSCYSTAMKWTWGQMQLCFIPEAESDFKIYAHKEKK